MITRAATVCKALGEPTRLAIVKLLSMRELCICELTVLLDMSQPRISQHMKVLKQAGLVCERRVRQRSYYTLNAAELQGGEIRSLGDLLAAPLEAVPELAEASSRMGRLDQDVRVQRCKSA